MPPPLLGWGTGFDRCYFFEGIDKNIVNMSGVHMMVAPTTLAAATMVLIMAISGASFDYVVAGVVSPAKDNNVESRQLSSSCRNSDDALDPTKVG